MQCISQHCETWAGKIEMHPLCMYSAREEGEEFDAYTQQMCLLNKDNISNTCSNHFIIFYSLLFFYEKNFPESIATQNSVAGGH
jgi:hypothetical protein